MNKKQANSVARDLYRAFITRGRFEDFGAEHYARVYSGENLVRVTCGDTTFDCVIRKAWSQF